MKKYKTVYELLKERRRWIKHVFCESKDGWSCPPTSSLAVRWCLRGAIRKIHEGHEPIAVTEKLWAVIGEKRRKFFGGCLGDFNNRSTHAEVLAVVKKAKI